MALDLPSHGRHSNIAYCILSVVPNSGIVWIKCNPVVSDLDFSSTATNHFLISLFCIPRANINAPSRGSSATATPAIHFFDPVSPSSSSVPPQSSEEDSLPPHLLLPDSISQLEEFGRQKKWHKKQYKNHRQRQFNDLWVRIEDGWVYKGLLSYFQHLKHFSDSISRWCFFLL